MSSPSSSSSLRYRARPGRSARSRTSSPRISGTAASRSTRTAPGRRRARRSGTSTPGSTELPRESRCSSARTWTPCRRPRRSSRWSRTASSATATRRLLAEGRPHAGLELLFTPKEEVGLVGAYAFDHRRLRARTGYVYDQAAPIGTVILGAPFSQSIEVTFHGRASHSGMHPEDGRSAIAAAARAIAELRLGRVDELSTANVGKITGGTAANIVPEWCTFVAEARSHDERKLAELVQEMQDA